MDAAYRSAVSSWNRERCVVPTALACVAECCSLPTGGSRTWVLKACQSSDSEKCVPCELKYRKQIRTVAREILFVAKPRTTLMLTLTAPGSKPHCTKHSYRSRNAHGNVVFRPSIRCDFTVREQSEELPIFPAEQHELCPCASTLLDSDAKIAEWNLSAVARWNKFLTDIRRMMPEFARVEYFKAVEPQKRKAIHLHVLLLTPVAVAVRKETLDSLKYYAMLHGFGHEVQLDLIGSSETEKLKTARYVAKYVSKSNANSRKDILLPIIPNSAPSPRSQAVLNAQDLDRSFALLLHDTDGEIQERSDLAAHAGVSWRKLKEGFGTPAEEVVNEATGEVLGTTATVQGMLQRTKPKGYRYRAWTCSRGWGLNLGRVRQVQLAHHLEGAEASALLFEQFLEEVREFQGAEPATP